jgi:DNA-binding NtrC family response regulator
MGKNVKRFRFHEDETEVVAPCDGPMRLRRMSLYVAQGPRAGKRFPVEQERFVVGKGKGADLLLPDPTVSRNHLEILTQGDTFLIRDLDSTNGTSVDGTRIKEAFLAPGSRISVGNAELIFQAFYESPGPDLQESEEFGGLIAAAPAMKSIMGLLRRAATLGTTVVLRGETGVGKSALARALHDEGPRSNGPFVVFDCGSVPPTLIESELFGAEKGAFTGAVQSRPGAFEQAHGGTLFLDEIEELPLELQPKLLRVLEEKEVRRLGATKPIALDLHIITASKTDLPTAVNEGRFRADLYYRIAVIDVEVPPLRDRPEDLPLLCDHFLDESQGSESWDRLTPALREQFESYAWPGNLRELRNVLERLQCIGHEDSPVADGAAVVRSPGQPLALDWNRPFKEAKEDLVDTFEQEYLKRLLERSGGAIAPAAREAGLNRKYFYDLLEKHGLHRRKK